MSYRIKPEDISVNLAGDLYDNVSGVTLDASRHNIAAILNAAIEAGLVSPPCHYIAYPSGMPVMHEPGEPIQIFPGKCTEPHDRHWKGQTE